MILPLDTLIATLQSGTPAERIEAAEQLCRAGEDAQGASVALVRATGDGESEVRQWAAAALEESGPPRLDDVVPLIELLEHEFPDIGYWAATLLGRLGDVANGAVPVLTAALRNHAALPVRQRAAWALGKIGKGPPETIQALTAAVSDENKRLGRLAIAALEEIRGKEAVSKE